MLLPITKYSNLLNKPQSDQLTDTLTNPSFTGG